MEGEEKAQRISFSAIIKKNIDVGMMHRRRSAAQDVARDATQEAIQYHEAKTLHNDNVNQLPFPITYPYPKPNTLHHTPPFCRNPHRLPPTQVPS